MNVLRAWLADRRHRADRTREAGEAAQREWWDRCAEELVRLVPNDVEVSVEDEVLVRRDGVVVASVDADAFMVHGLDFEDWDAEPEARARWIAGALDDACAVISVPLLLGGEHPARALRDTGDPYAYSGIVAPVDEAAAWYGVARAAPVITWRVRAEQSDVAASEVARTFVVGQRVPVIARGQAASVTTFADPDGRCAVHVAVDVAARGADGSAGVFAVVEVFRPRLLVGIHLGEGRDGLVTLIHDDAQCTRAELLEDFLRHAGQLEWRGNLLESTDGRCWLRRPE